MGRKKVFGVAYTFACALEKMMIHAQKTRVYLWDIWNGCLMPEQEDDVAAELDRGVDFDDVVRELLGKAGFVDYAPAKPKRKGISPKQRFAIFIRDEFLCVYCGRGVPDGVKLTVDHKKSVKDGGRSDLPDLVTACFECNSGKGAKSL